MDTNDGKTGVIIAESMQQTGNQDEHYGLPLARRGGGVVDSDVDSTDIPGFEADHMRARTLLTAEEEKKLLRRIDWHIMPLCSFMLMLKSMDADDVRQPEHHDSVGDDVESVRFLVLCESALSNTTCVINF